ncbi:MAG: metallophosphoesterase [Burkholderiales bacterium]|nr:metallophosphoesterase [Burkholderiales bacterium]
MRMHVLSDLHLEVSPFTPPDTRADVVILAGDVHNASRGLEWAVRSFRGKRVVYVPGNHEYYDGELDAIGRALAVDAARLGVTLLDNAEAVIDGVRFLGTTLWTDFCLDGIERREEVMALARPYVVDFRAIRSGSGPFTPEASVDLHLTARAWLEARLAARFDGKTVVVTHHAPHPGSIHARFANHPANGSFVSNLEPLMGRTALWIHGHTHNSFDYRVNGTRVVCNSRGYVLTKPRTGAPEPDVIKAENPEFDPALTLEL